eukprot:228113_1
MQVPMYYPAPQTTTTTAFIGGQNQQQILCCNPTQNTIYSQSGPSQYSSNLSNMPSNYPQSATFNGNATSYPSHPGTVNSVSSVIPSNYNHLGSMNTVNTVNTMNTMSQMNNMNLNNFNTLNSGSISMLNMASGSNSGHTNAFPSKSIPEHKYSGASAYNHNQTNTFNANNNDDGNGGTQTCDSKLSLNPQPTVSGDSKQVKPQYTLITSYTPQTMLNGMMNLSNLDKKLNLTQSSNANTTHPNYNHHDAHYSTHGDVNAINGANLNIFPIDPASKDNKAPFMNHKNTPQPCYSGKNAFNMATMPCPPSMQVNHSATSTTSTSTSPYCGNSPTGTATNISIQPISMTNNTNHMPVPQIPSLPNNLNLQNMVAGFPNMTAFELTHTQNGNQPSLVNIFNNDLSSIPSMSVHKSGDGIANTKSEKKKASGEQTIKRFGCSYCGKRFTLKQNL